MCGTHQSVDVPSGGHLWPPGKQPADCMKFQGRLGLVVDTAKRWSVEGAHVFVGQGCRGGAQENLDYGLAEAIGVRVGRLLL